jgi:hypothetical protein
LVRIPDAKLRTNPRAFDAELRFELARYVLDEIVGIQKHAN